MKVVALSMLLGVLMASRGPLARAYVSSAASAFTRTNGLKPCRYFSSTKLSMKLQTAIVGLPNVGKSTLFNALTETQGAEAANYPFCTIEPNVGIVEVPDPKLPVLEKINESVKVREHNVCSHIGNNE